MGIVAALADGVGVVALDGEARAGPLADALAALAETDARAVLVEAPAGAALDAWPGALVRWLWRDFPPPVVFAFEGDVAGALAALAIGCDLRVCGERAAIAVDGLGDAPALERARTLLRLAPGGFPAVGSAGGGRGAGAGAGLAHGPRWRRAGGGAGGGGRHRRARPHRHAAGQGGGLARPAAAARTGPAFRDRFDLAAANDQRSGGRGAGLPGRSARRGSRGSSA